MCIIAYAKRKELLQEKTLEECFVNNPDGAGFMFRLSDNGLVTIKKGFMSFEALNEALQVVPNEAEIAVHCRIATSGRVSGGMCHPFPITMDYKTMRKTDIISRSAMAHNGVIGFCEPAEGIKAAHSDTMQFIRNYVTKLMPSLHTPEIEVLIGKATASRFLTFDKGHAALFWGSWVEHEGCKFSNTSYLPYTYEYKNYNWAAGGYPLDEDVYKLEIVLEGAAGMEDTELFDKLLELTDELDIDCCYPDFEAATYYQQDKDIIFEIMVLQVPTLNNILGHKYRIATSTSETSPTKAAATRYNLF